MEKVFELRISSYSDIRELTARLAHEMRLANQFGKECIVEIWKEKTEVKNHVNMEVPPKELV